MHNIDHNYSNPSPSTIGTILNCNSGSGGGIPVTSEQTGPGKLHSSFSGKLLGIRPVGSLFIASMSFEGSYMALHAEYPPWISAPLRSYNRCV